MLHLTLNVTQAFHITHPPAPHLLLHVVGCHAELGLHTPVVLVDVQHVVRDGQQVVTVAAVDVG